jgi:NitT/TauT family transport system substrate-binding protein
MKLRIGHLSTLYHTAHIINAEKMLEKKGITPSWQLYGGGPAIVEALVKDEIDLGYIGLPPAMIGISKGAKIKCVAGGHIEGTALITKEKITGRTKKKIIEELKGRRIGSPPKGSIHDVLIQFILKQHRVKSTIVNYPWADFIPLAMEKNEISAAIGTPALAIYLKQKLNASIALPPRRIWPFNPSYGIIAAEHSLNCASLKKFLHIHEEACNIIIKDPRKSAYIASKTLGFIDTGFAFEVIRLSPHYCSALPREYVKSTMDFVPFMRELGYIREKLGEEKIFHLDLIREIHAEKDHYHEPLKN